MRFLYILGPGGIAIPEPDPIKWSRWFEQTQRQVAVTEIGDSTISTVFLGIDHRDPPYLWETIVFGGTFNHEKMRYPTREEAEAGHNEMVGRVTREALPRKPIRNKGKD